ncbi:TonB-dependent siderophore receptor [Methylocapsa palsarum]|nr:TonB-dependent receptor [Methylocapsa palsarum]
MSSALAACAAGACAIAMVTPASKAQASIAPEERSGALKAYRVPPGSIAAALNDLADANELHVVFDARLTQGMRTPGLSGQYSLRGALDRLLAGTRLSYTLSDNGRTVSIVLAQNDTATQSDAGAVALPEVSATAAAGGVTGDGSFGGAGPGQDPFNTTYVLEDATTGTKTDTPIMDTPLNVQVITQQVLRDQQVITLDQALQNVSGVTVSQGPGGTGGTQNAYNAIVLRGFATNNYFRDGFRVDTGDGGFSQQMANVASVEVLKGPAAVLYGLGEPGGIVNIITKEPLNTPYFAATQQIGSFANFRTTFDATGPVTQDGAFLYRMNMSYQNNGAPSGAPVDLTHAQDIFIAPVLKWNVDGANWVKLEAQYDENRSANVWPFAPLYNGVFVPIPRSRNYGEYSPDTLKTLFAALTWKHEFDQDWSVKQQLAYRRTEDTARYTVPAFLEDSGSELLVNRFLIPSLLTQTTYSTNVDITGHIDTFGVKHTLLLGGDVYRTTFGNQSWFDNGPFSQISLWNPIHPGTPFVGPVLPSYASDNTQFTSGLYLQDQIKLPYNFYAMAGARYQYIRQTSATGTIPADLTASPTQTASALTPRFGLLWRPESWVSFYANYSEGFGPNSGLIYPGTPVPPTGAREGEAGVKLELFEGKCR